MADTKITALTALTAADPANDVIPIVDVSDTSMAASGTTKKISVNNILGASGTATLASATITGDLTVDTSTLKVDSTNNRVIVGHTSGSAAFQVTNAGAAGLEIQPTGFSSAPLIQSYNRSGSAYTQLTLDASTIVHALSGTTAMTLNSTGLGIGRGPLTSLDVFGANKTNANEQGTLTVSSSDAFAIDKGGSIAFFGKYNTASGNACFARVYGAKENAIDGNFVGYFAVATGGGGSPVERFRIDSTGNVGIGSTSPNSRLQIVGATDDALVQSYIRFSRKGYESSVMGASISASGGSVASQNNLVFNTSDGTNAPAERVRIDGSGNLLVGKTGNNGTVGAGTINEPSGPIWSTMAASTSAGNTLLVYSTGAAAYRFYVGLGGTVNATNPVISAISDARLKENVQDIDVGLAAILSLKPRKFDWKTGKGKDIKGDRGFIAQEFETVFPNLIDEWKDAAPEGEAPYKSVRQDLIPVLVKAIQELTARVQTLEAR